MVRSLFVLLLVALALGRAAATPTLFWASDPVGPSETVLVLGDGFGEKPAIEVTRLPDGPAGTPGKPFAWTGKGTRLPALQAGGTSAKFVLPGTWPPGVYAYRLSGAVGLLNRPAVWWARGNGGTTASPGGWVRVFGKNLSMQKTAKPSSASVLLRGPKTLSLKAQGDGYALKAALPKDLPPGAYRLYAHNGCGGVAAWSDPVMLVVTKPRAWPAQVFDVRTFGADGTGAKDDTAAVQAALAKAAEAGGGVVYFPRGRYQLSEMLQVPRFVTLRGEKREWVNLLWPDLPEPPEALIRGTNSFAMEELTLYASNHRHVIAGDPGSQPDAGNVRIHRVRVRADAYRGHLKPEQVDERFRWSLRWSTGGPDTLRLGGENVVVTECDLYGSGRSLYLSRARGALVAGNSLYNGRWGWYCLEGSDGLIFEGNRLTGGDLMSTGGGIANYSTACSRNVYYARNVLSLMHGWDREAMTSDAGGEAYIGKALETRGATMKLAAEPKWGSRNWKDAGVFILDGKGAGQYRHLADYKGAEVTLDRPWAVPPDSESDVCITMFHGRYLLVGNTFTDTGAVQFYGTSVECIVAGNEGTRMQGFRGLGLWYHGYQPSWFCQFLDNRLREGNYYHWTSATNAFIEVFGAKRAPYTGPLNRASILRRNRLDSNATIRVAGTCRDALVEGNHVADSDQGIFISRDCANVLARGNTFTRVKQEMVDEEAIRRAAEERLREYIGRKEPVAAWSFEESAAGKFADASGNGFHAAVEGTVAAVEGGVRGKAARFDGKSCVRVAETAVFNAPDVTLSLWVKPETLRGRRGFIAKRYAGTGAPFVFGQVADRLAFEATDEGGAWSLNFAGPAVLKEGAWTHLAVVLRRGEGVTLYADGEKVAEKRDPAIRQSNMEPLVLGREAWGGDPPKGDTPGYFLGLMDEVKVWTRALTPGEIAAEAR